MNLGTLEIEQLIVHDVPIHRVGASDNPTPDMSEAPSQLDVEVRNLFTERLKRSLDKNAYVVERDPESTSPVPDLMQRIATAKVTDDDVFVEASQTMAQHLFSTQTGSNNEGLLIVCRARIDGQPAVTVMKLEREDAVHLRPDQKLKGKRTFGVDYLRDLMLGKNTRVFKAGLFVFRNGVMDGLVSDSQKNDPISEVANFFLHRFLGARLKEAPEVSTRALFAATESFINTLSDPEKQARYQTALIAAMNAPSKSIRYGTISAQFDVGDRKPYALHLKDADAPLAKIDKDTRLIAPQLRQMIFDFKSSKLRVSGPVDDVKEYVRFKETQGHKTMEILDEVKDVRGGSR